ncbi:MAG: SDR family oxidoreductase [Ectothiorhodospiraceae bacterium]|nr:SDR family oxidoreductase [Chromatiales bacterium]MCP5156564.1 SDR family oxidoreductase [Ectothiorhodospiraceae bacterium]
MNGRRVALITGGSRGIGAATARRLATDGFAVAINYRERDDAAAALAADIASGGGVAITVGGDVASEPDVMRMFAEVDDRLGPVTAVVNSAGISGNKSAVARFRGDVLQRLLAVNVLGTMLCCREAVRRMSIAHGGAGGAIVNVSSMASTIGGRPGASDYGASKAAVDAFTVGLAKEVADEGVRVNAIRPGMVITDMTDEQRSDPDRFAVLCATIPMNRMATAEEIADPIAWLLSDAASFITGACVDASGGGFVVGQRQKV